MEINYQEIIKSTESKIDEIRRKAQAEIAKLQKSAIKASIELFSEIGWDSWDESQLDSEEQYARFQKAFTGKMQIESIDYGNKCGQVRGSAIYDVSENGCTCKDCSVRRLPCKHMYFLAYWLSKGEADGGNLQLTLDKIDKKQDDNISVKSEQLGCCSLFRDCSRAGRCLQEDDYYKQCSYRKNLENGKIFYTEKSERFSKERYNYIENFRQSLDEGERIVFDEILTYFEKVRRGCRNCFCLFTPQIKNIVEKCKAFEAFSSKELVLRVFGADLISNTRASELHEKYSSLPKPELISLLPKLPETATEKEKEERKKKNKTIGNKNLKIWEKHFLSDADLQKVVSEGFLYFRESDDYSFELDEYFIANYREIARELKELVYFDADNPKVFRENIV